MNLYHPFSTEGSARGFGGHMVPIQGQPTTDSKESGEYEICQKSESSW